MIDRSREEVATAMIPNHLYRQLSMVDNDERADPSRCLITGQIMRIRDTYRLYSIGTIVSRDLRDETILFSKYSSYFRSGECVSFNLNLINPPYACPRWKTESIYSALNEKKKNILIAKDEIWKNCECTWKASNCESANKKKEDGTRKWIWISILSAEWVPSLGFSVTVNRQSSQYNSQLVVLW